jgi:LysM repeat protein
MSVQQIIKAIYGTFVPTGVYSFEFRHNGKTITEIFFTLPPESVSVSEPQRSALMPTLGGGYLVDFGNEFKDIHISGSSHFYFAGSERNPIAMRPPAGANDLVDGYSEFLKLRFMVSRHRDYTLTPRGKLKAPDFSSAGLTSTQALKDFVRKHIKSKDGALADNVEMIYHDYDYDDHFKVKVENLQMSRDKSDPFTVKYDISLKAYQVDTKNADAILGTPEVLLTSAEWVNDAVKRLSGSHSESIPLTATTEGFRDITTPLPVTGNWNDINALDMPRNDTLAVYNANLAELRAKLQQANSKIQAGVVSTRRAIGTLDSAIETVIKNILSTIEVLVIPKNVAGDFQNGVVTIDQYASWDTMAYYNGLRRLHVELMSLRAAMYMSQADGEQAISIPQSDSGGTFIDVLDSDEFTDQGYGTPVTDRREQYTYHTVQQGDTMMSIAIKYYGDYHKWTRIATANSLDDDDFLSDDIVGQTIKVPIQQSALLARGNDNLVYEPLAHANDPASIERSLYGSDIDTSNGRLSVDGRGDIKRTAGIPCVMQNVSRRITTPKGGLNPLHPGYGIEGLAGSTKAPYLISIDRLIEDMEDQAHSDPRVVSAVLARDKLKLRGDRIDVPITIDLIGEITSGSIIEVPHG